MSDQSFRVQPENFGCHRVDPYSFLAIKIQVLSLLQEKAIPAKTCGCELRLQIVFARGVLAYRRLKYDLPDGIVPGSAGRVAALVGELWPVSDDGDAGPDDGRGLLRGTRRIGGVEPV